MRVPNSNWEKHVDEIITLHIVRSIVAAQMDWTHCITNYEKGCVYLFLLRRVNSTNSG